MHKEYKNITVKMINNAALKTKFLYFVFPQFENFLKASFGLNDFENESLVNISDDDFEKILNNSIKDINPSIMMMKDILDKIFEKNDCITVVIENNYVDRIYRDCYYSHFSGKHFEYNRYCKRILFFSGDQEERLKFLEEDILNKNFLGCIVIKPIKNGAIGKTLLSPKVLHTDVNKKIYVRITEYSISFCGMNLKIEAFPYSMQDRETLSCAEVTILNILDYYSNNYSDYKFTLPSDIYSIISNHGFERPLPTTGMSYTMISKLLLEFGFFPKLYVANEGYTDEQMRRILSYYVESAIPVALGLQYRVGYNHSIVCIGHGDKNENIIKTELYRTFETDDGTKSENLFIADTANSHDELIVMDDNLCPYSTYGFRREQKNIFSIEKESLLFGKTIQGGFDTSSKILCIAVPLYKRMQMDAENARYICIEVLKDRKSSFKEFVDRGLGIEIGTAESPIVMRLFLASSRKFLHERMNSLPKDHVLRKVYKSTYFPKFIWVCELSSLSSYNKKEVIGEIILDATASATEHAMDSIISIFYPHLVCSQTREGKIQTELLHNINDSIEQQLNSNNLELEFIVLKKDTPENVSMYPMLEGNLKEF